MSPNKLTIVKKVTQEVCALIGAIFIDKITFYNLHISAGNTFVVETIPAVNMAKTTIASLWPATSNDAILSIPSYIELLNSTTLRASRPLATGSNFHPIRLIEYAYGIKSIQRFVVDLNSVSQINTAITAVNMARAIITPLGVTTNVAYGRSVSIRHEFTSSTNVQTTRFYGGALNSKASFEVVEFN